MKYVNASCLKHATHMCAAFVFSLKVYVFEYIIKYKLCRSEKLKIRQKFKINL